MELITTNNNTEEEMKLALIISRVISRENILKFHSGIWKHGVHI